MRLYGVFAGIFSAILATVPVASTKIFTIGPLQLPGGTVIFPLVFILNDILTEVYGYDGSRRIIWTGLVCQGLAALTLAAVGALPPATSWPNQAAYDAILGIAPRIALASFTAYFCGEFANSFVLSRMKYHDAGRGGLRQGWRFLASTIVGEGVDSAIFMVVAYFGIIPSGDLWRTLATLYVAKVLYEAAALPFSIPFANWVKRVEGLDSIDSPATTNYNPFCVFSVQRRGPRVPGAR